MTAPALRLRGVTVERGAAVLLDGIDWEVGADQRWIVLGPNGAGKTTLIRVASMHLHPTGGTVEVLGERLGRVDVRRLRSRIGFTSASMAEQLRPRLTATEIVMTAKHGALEPWWHTYDDADRHRARALLARQGCARLADRTMATLSSGERQRVLLARMAMADPALFILDEPCAGLDLAGRERLVAAMTALATDRANPPSILVTHHVDEIPPGFTHGLFLRAGRVVASGPLNDLMTEERLSALYDLPIDLAHRNGRWSATSRP